MGVGALLALNIVERKTTRQDVPPGGTTHHQPAGVLTKHIHPESDQPIDLTPNTENRGVC